MKVPLASAAGLDPPSALLILNHELLELLLELLLSEVTALLALFELGVEAVYLSKIHSLILRLGHLALASLRSLFVNMEGQMA